MKNNVAKINTRKSTNDIINDKITNNITNNIIKKTEIICQNIQI